MAVAVAVDAAIATATATAAVRRQTLMRKCEVRVSMGLFDKVLGGNKDADKLNEAESMAGIALAAIAADGMITEEEAAGLGTSLSRMKLFQNMSDRDVNRVFEKLIKVARNDGVDKLIEKSAHGLRAELKPTAFTLAADLLMADGNVAPEERAFLEKIQKWLAIPDAEALRIVEVIAIKNRA